MALRQSVKITYAHKRARTQANNHITSSPLEPLASDHDDITRSEMSRRMLKRSRRAAYPEFDDGDIIERKRVSERLRKKPKKSEALCQVSDPNAMTTSDLLPPDALTFQTPFPSSDYINPLNITRPLIPEQLSPVPLSRSRLSRTSSRNLKENGRRSRFLESPFHSRPGSAAPSPQNKGRPRKNQNASLHTKSRTLSRGFEENRSKRSSRPDSYASCHNSTKNSPNKLSMHQRRPSNPTPSYMLEHITQQEWMIPPKALIRPSAARVTPPYLSPIPTQNSSFLSDHPQFYSTPLQCRAGSRTGLVPPDDSPIYKPLAQVMDHPNLDERFDVEMDDVTEPHARQTIHIHGNSIISSSGEFTLGPTATTEFVGIESPNGSDTHLSGVSPVHEPTERYPLRRLARVAVGDYNIRLASMTCSPSPGSATQNLCQVAPRVACKKEAKNVQKVFVGVVPLNLPHAATSPSLMDADIASDFCYDSQSCASKSLTPNTPPQSPVRDIGPSSPANSLIQEMQSLGLRGMFPLCLNRLFLPNIPAQSIIFTLFGSYMLSYIARNSLGGNVLSI
ncbi:hypothetical protein BJ138DRAFT_127873 [Hygrophoropsis aurantiaca]|uniref:Uncharacterized protein n=1 Tax=Hygrophoropsis aurantiaca TaxID=72124 RepID=A0ACB8AB34_9AGAM|nr:hypothetical protein BJ138DRAFT_127873 [Hygrophoropsis aurantiaca]